MASEQVIDLDGPTASEMDVDNSSKNDNAEDDAVKVIAPPEAPVIDLDDSDSDSVVTIQDTRKKSDCINPDCFGSNENLVKACGYTLSYFKMKPNSFRKQVICQKCSDMILKQYDVMCESLINHEPIFNHKIPLPENDCVEIDDSDDEDVASAIKLPPDELKLLKRELDYCILDVFAKFKIDTQINQNITLLEKEYDKLEKLEESLNTELNTIQVGADKVRNIIYSHKPQTQEITGIDIDQQGFVVVHTKVGERRSNRKIMKPISDYNEVESNFPKPHVEEIRTRPAFIPKLGPVIREAPKINDVYYAMKTAAFGAWTKCTLLEIFQKGVVLNDKPIHENTYRVSFIQSKVKPGTTTKNIVKLVTGKQMAYSKPCDVRLPIGSRVIALFREAENTSGSEYYAGVIAEPLTNVNNFRYLIFFDDGYAQYVNHEDVNQICDVSDVVWEDIPIDSRGYIQEYLSEYPERPMVKLSKGQVVRTERNGKWWPAKVLEVDGSLVLMYFENDARKEWIYRGSRRLAPLYNTNYNQQQRQKQGMTTPIRRIPGRVNFNQPYVEYTRTAESEDTSQDLPANVISSRAVARKSTTNVATKSTVNHLSNAIVPFLPSKAPSQSRVVYYTTKTGKLPELYQPHQCGPTCKENSPRSLADLKSYSMLAQPILAGWYRETVRFGKNKREVRYVTPCGRIVRNMKELHRYLRITQSDFSVDMFDFNSVIHVLTLHVTEEILMEIKDFSQSQEKTPIPLVNDIDKSLPAHIRYSAEREPTEGVHLNTDEEFLCGCDCTDDCQDKTKCQCWQLTLQGTKMGKNTAPLDMSAGYVYKRLLDPVVTGIYECNSRCKCKAKTCLNRVVQHPLQLKLQVFKTPNRGWGIRCLHDVPRGAFICIYAGQLLTEARANEGGINFGDEYLAELDYIEVVERLKEGYESDVDDIEEDGDDKHTDEDEDYDPARETNYYSDRDFTYQIPKSQNSETAYRTRSRRRNMDESSEASSDTSEIKVKTNKKKTNKKDQQQPSSEKKTTADEDETVNISDEETIVRQPSSFIPKMEAQADDEWQPKYKSVRKMFGADESCYIMDAKCAGNIGRFLNHSCSPNVFVQNVFVDTHDLRFPWVAFFASSHVKAGVELTWNYNYDVGSVPGKILYCHCGSEECRGRLL